MFHLNHMPQEYSMILKLTGKKSTYCYYRHFDNFRHLPKYYVPIFGVNCFTKILYHSNFIEDEKFTNDKLTGKP